MILDQEHPSFGGPARIRRLWPEMHGESIDPEMAASGTYPYVPSSRRSRRYVMVGGWVGCPAVGGPGGRMSRRTMMTALPRR